MARRSATRLQLSGHRFLLRRMAHALVRGDVRMLDDPLRAQAVAYGAGCALTAVAIAVCAVLALLRPGSVPGDAPILLARDTGALFVRVDDTVHPVSDLASARLIVGMPANPVVVNAAAIAKFRRGPLVGIPGAPAQLGQPLSLDESDWTICDDTEPAETVLLAGRADRGMVALGSGHALLVSARTMGGATYLLADGWRARVDVRDIAVVRALHLEGVSVQLVSQALLDSVPEAPALRAPSIVGVGNPGPAALGGLAVGTVVRVVRAGPAEFYVVLTDGLQRVGRVAADVIRFSVAQSHGEPPLVPADVVADVPVADHLAVPRFPERVVPRVPAVVCANWDPRRRGSATNTSVVIADSLPDHSVRLAQADGTGPNVDRVVIPGGRSVLLQAAGVTRDGIDGGPLYLLNDLGVLFGIRDGATAETLGLGTDPVPAPWPMLAMLPRGPELNREAASVTRDAMTGAGVVPA
ncbi:type VII secretion protein EccB [Mycolicibacterium peregrinum]|uniref:type VII secretion protein EccB n=1 Tax=Mycolicibacterium peregrinum TaxID=43304 RepID=UPI0006D80F68|nr:type VII secretion protein EccB [Mycolicibacterium peregrinum]MCV7203463.1 type VII secretion protein EccB [Mycolicibacterium peregrinum]ORW59139.1 type VII secretion protein EccB [Mycolicibacterium peregrinum]OWM08453.1 type VII secretion protein EccB [Mycolicibacterium peregrinum]